MCRLYGFIANELTKVECSLVRAQNVMLAQHRDEPSAPRRASGWGIVCYGDVTTLGSRIPDLVRHKTAVDDETKFSHTAESMYARAVVAHIRMASVGYLGSLNSHPFTYDAWTFAHSGTLSGFDRLEPQLAEETGNLQDDRLGTTDSEQFFLWLLNQFRQDHIDLDSADQSSVQRSIANAVVELNRRCLETEPNEAPKLTFVLTNGQFMIGCCWNEPLCWLVRRGIPDCEICGLPHIRHDNSVEYRAVVLASEPITNEMWEVMPNFSLYTVSDEIKLSTTKLKLSDIANGVPK